MQAKARSVFGGRFVQLVINNEDVDTSMLTVRYGLGRHMPMLAGGLPEPLFIVGPYGAACGKAELIQRLMRDCPDVFAQPVPCTTRRGNRKAMTDGPFQVSIRRSLSNARYWCPVNMHLHACRYSCVVSQWSFLFFF